MSEYSDETLILHMHDAIAKIREYTKGGREEFLRDRKTQDAVYRNLEIIGEAVKHLSQRMRSDHPDVEWQEAAKMRDVLIHDYAEINPTIIWSTIEKDLPPFSSALEKVRKPA